MTQKIRCLEEENDTIQQTLIFKDVEIVDIKREIASKEDQIQRLESFGSS